MAVIARYVSATSRPLAPGHRLTALVSVNRRHPDRRAKSRENPSRQAGPLVPLANAVTNRTKFRSCSSPRSRNAGRPLGPSKLKLSTTMLRPQRLRTASSPIPIRTGLGHDAPGAPHQRAARARWPVAIRSSEQHARSGVQASMHDEPGRAYSRIVSRCFAGNFPSLGSSQPAAQARRERGPYHEAAPRSPDQIVPLDDAGPDVRCVSKPTPSSSRS